jgi:hypothetical protein
MKRRYTFRTPDGERCNHVQKPTTTAVVATSEAEARSLAMHARWGPPFGIWQNVGAGLLLESVEDLK